MTSFEQKRYYNFHRTTKKIIDHTIHIPFHIILPIDQRIILISLTDIPKDLYDLQFCLVNSSILFIIHSFLVIPSKYRYTNAQL